MENFLKITEFFEELETEREYCGYFCSVGEALTIVILGSICGLKNVRKIQQWAKSPRVSVFLENHFKITDIPCYYWLTCLLKIIKPKSFNLCFIKWAQSFLPFDKTKNLTVSFDGKTVCSTGKMDKYESPLHIVSAQIAELGITVGQQTVNGKSNEIPAVRDLLTLLDIKGCVVVADALNCQKATAKAIIEKEADYLLNVKDNHINLKQNIENVIKERISNNTVNTCTQSEKNGGRIERRTAYTIFDIKPIKSKEEWSNLACIGAINRKFTTKKGTSDEWHYYISSKQLSAEELLKHARLEWSVETMHWLLDVHFDEDFCRFQDKNVQQNLNMIRKIVLNNVRNYKEKTKTKSALSKIMFDCLLDSEKILEILT